jgi:hypothetical protein
MNWFFRFWSYFERIILPARFRRYAFESRVTHALDRAAMKLDKPHEALDHAADQATRKLEKRGKAPDAAAAAAAPQPTPRGVTFGTIVRWVLHLLLVAAVLVGLWYLNGWLGLERLLRSDWPFLHPYWLPLLFLILYVLAWLGGWLWQLTGPDHVGWDYPYINQAWDEAVMTLAAAGIDPRTVPLFLVLGRPEGPEDALFLGAELGLRVWHAPRYAGAPLHVYGSPGAVFVTCAGASVLGEHGTLFAQERAGLRDVPAVATETAEAKENADHPGEGQTAEEPEAAALPGVTKPEPATPEPGPDAKAEADLLEEERALGLLVADPEKRPRGERRSRTFLKDTAAAQQVSYRLQHLCRLIARDRRPYCPINGVVVLIPYAALADDPDASAVGTACRYDLMLLRTVLQEQCPGYALVCDMESSEGFRELLRRLSGQRVGRLGQRFPLLPDIDEEKLPHMVDEGVTWLTDALLPSLAYTLFRLGLAKSRGWEQLQGSARLYRLLSELHERRGRLSRLLSRAFLLDDPHAYLFGGVFLAPTGPDARPPLTAGVLAQVIDNQNAVAWTAQALASERRYRWWTWLGWLVIVAVVVAVPVLAFVLWRP